MADENRRRINAAILNWHRQNRNQQAWQQAFNRTVLFRNANPLRFQMLLQRQRKPIRKTKRS